MKCNARQGLGLAIALAFMQLSISAPRAQEADRPFDEIKTEPVTVVWEYSKDGGSTFASVPQEGPLQGVSPNRETRVFDYAWKGTFEIDDPAQVAGLWVRLTTGENSRASICNGDLVAASGGYWKDLGFCPTLLNAVITLNGKDVAFPRGPLLQFWVPLTGELKKGANTVSLRGRVYSYWRDPPAKAIDAEIIKASPQPAAIYNGPILGDFGEDYFTLACRTQLPAELTVEATPTDPAAPAVTVSSARALWHRVKIEVPKGTRKLTYTVSARVGSHETKRGPYALAMPEKEYRFAAFGNAMQHRAKEGDPWTRNAKQILAAEPAFVLNTGNPYEHGAWSFRWEAGYTGPAAELLARVPTLITPCDRDFTGIFNELHVTPAADTYAHNWTKVVGPVRFIGLDGNQTWAEGNENIQWLEGVLREARDKFIVVLCGYPGYSSGRNSKKLYAGLHQSRLVIQPLLAKYKATLMLSGWDPNYERLEPTADKGVTQVVTGAIGLACWHKWSSTFGAHPFGPGGDQANPPGAAGKILRPDGGEWVGYCGTRHFCLFDVKADALEMKVLACGATPDAQIKDRKVIDQKTFKPRN